MEILFALSQFGQKMAKLCYSATEQLRRKFLGVLHPERGALLSFEGAIYTPCARTVPCSPSFKWHITLTLPPGFRSLCLYNIIYKDRGCL